MKTEDLHHSEATCRSAGDTHEVCLKVKINSHGNLIKYKACLVTQGFFQVEGEDYTQSYMPVAHAAAVRLIMAIVTMMNMRVTHVDVSQAFLQAPLTEKIYCLPPKGFKTEEGEAWLMLNSVYGLVQSPYNWHKTLTMWLISFGCKAIGFNGCLYMMCCTLGELLLIVLYVDDLAIACTHLAFELLFKTALKACFKCSEDDDIEWYLSVHY